MREDREDTAGRGAEDERSAQGNLARARRCGREERSLPVLGELDGPIPFFRSAAAARDQLVAADLAGRLVHRHVERMPVDGCRGGVHPQARRIWRDRRRPDAAGAWGRCANRGARGGCAPCSGSRCCGRRDGCRHRRPRAFPPTGREFARPSARFARARCRGRA